MIGQKIFINVAKILCVFVIFLIIQAVILNYTSYNITGLARFITRNYFHQYDIDIDQTKVSMHQNIILLNIQNLKIDSITSDNKIAIETLELDLDIIKMMLFNSFLENIKIRKFHFHFDEINIDTNQNGIADYKDQINKFFANTNNSLYTNIDIQDGSLALNVKNKPYLININNITNSAADKQILSISGKIKETKFSFQMQSSTSKGMILESLINYSNIPIFDITTANSSLKDLPFYNIFIKQTEPILISGGATISYDNGKLKNCSLYINKGDNLIKTMNLAHQQNPLTITNFDVNLLISNYGDNIKLDKFKVVFADKTVISTTAKIKFNPLFINNFNNNIEEFNLKYHIENIPVAQLNTLWPQIYATDVRDWVLSSLKNGHVTSGDGSFYFDKEFLKYNKLKNENIIASLSVKDTDLFYYKDFPEIKNMTGDVVFNAEVIKANVKIAKLETSDLTKCTVIIPYRLNKINLSGQAKGPISDYIAYIPSNIINELNNYNIDLNKMKNTSTSEIALSIFLDDNFSNESIDFDIKSKIPKLILSGISSPVDLQSINLNIKNQKNFFHLKGEGLLENRKFLLDYNFKDHINNAIFESSFTNQLLKIFGLDKEINIKSDSDCPFKVEYNNNIINLNSDLKNCEYSFKKISFFKPTNVMSQLSLNAKINNGKINSIENITLHSNKEKLLDAKVELTNNDVKQFNVKINKLGNNKQINYEYHLDNLVENIKIKADTIDLANINFKDIFGDNNLGNLSKKINFNSRKIILKNDEHIENARLNYDCDSNLKCKILSADGLINNKDPVSLRYKIIDKDQFVKISTNNAASFLRGFGIYKNMKDGYLEIILKKDIAKNRSGRKYLKFDGDITIKRFYLSNQSFIMTMLLNITSATKIFKIFGNQFISIENFQSNLKYRDGYLSLEGGISDPSLKITMRGFVNLDNDIIRIRGDIVPSFYGVNTIISKTPIIGKILGGKSGGAIAASYYLSGSSNGVKTSINPLSLLPIGILKNIFTNDKTEEDGNKKNNH